VAKVNFLSEAAVSFRVSPYAPLPMALVPTAKLSEPTNGPGLAIPAVISSANGFRFNFKVDTV